MTVLAWTAALLCLAVAVGERRRLARRAELVARACHELRGPLTAARLGLSLVAAAPDPAAGPLAAVDQELRRAGLALADLAAAPRGRRAGERAQVVAVGGLLRRAVVAWAPAAHRAGARVRLRGCPLGAAVRADPVRLAQAVGNLLANAIEHGGGTIEVAARVAGGAVRIEICDGGPGLPAPVADLARGARAGRGRRGRGLAIAAEIAARHGGRLAAAPSSRGARLVLELPAAWPDGAVPLGSAPDRPASPNGAAPRKPAASPNGAAPRKPAAPPNGAAPRKPAAPPNGAAPRKPAAPPSGAAPRTPAAPPESSAPPTDDLAS